MNEENVPGKWVKLGMRKREGEGRRTKERLRGRTAGEKMTKVGERSRAAWSDCGLIWVHPCMHE